LNTLIRIISRLKSFFSFLNKKSFNSWVILSCDNDSIIKIKSDCTTRRNCFIWIQGPAMLSIGDNVFFNNGCSINCLDKIEIGSGSIFGEGVKMYDHNHKYTTDPIISISKDQFNTAPIIIGKNCWIGSNVTILKGVTIGDNVIIGANCLIYESIPSNSIVKLNQSLTIEKKE